MTIRNECRHAFYGVSKTDDENDFILLKVLQHNEDGSKEIVLKGIENYHMPFWTTKPAHRTHSQTKEYEVMSRLDKGRSNFRTLPKRSCAAVGVHNFKNDPRLMLNNPYIYGVSITPTAIIKDKFLKKDPDLFTNYTVAAIDIETDILYGTDETILISVTMGDKVYTATTALYTKGAKYCAKKWPLTYKHRFKNGWDKVEFEPIANFKDKFIKYFNETRKGIKIGRSDHVDFEIFETPLEAITAAVNKLHEWQPDFVTGWHIDFDISRILEDIKIWGGDAGDIFSDPCVPDQYRKLVYDKGNTEKKSVSDKSEALMWYDQYHVVRVLASFYIIDQAVVFRKERIANGKEPSMALDSILKKYTPVEKLKIPNYEHLSGLALHVALQTHSKVEYAVYNPDDCIGCEILDEQKSVLDLALTVPLALRNIDFDIYNSQPKRLVTDMHFFYLDHNAVLGGKGSKFVLELDDKTLAISEFIVTLNSHMVPYRKSGLVSNGTLFDLLFRAVFDLDVTGAYPDGHDKLNASRETTIAEIISIGNMKHGEMVELGLNLTAPDANAVSIVMNTFDGPSIQTLMIDYETNELSKRI